MHAWEGYIIKLLYLGIVIQDFFNKMADAQTHVLVYAALPAVASKHYDATALADFAPGCVYSSILHLIR